MRNPYLVQITVITALFICGYQPAQAKEPAYCGAAPAMGYQNLKKTVLAQKKQTQKVPIEKTIRGDLIFFPGQRWKCPNGVSGMVMDVGPGYLTFFTVVAEPPEQVVLFPRKKYKGNFWYKLGPKIRTLDPATDPPRPGDKGYVPQ